MSSQRGNVSKSRQQKHKNSTAYRNDMHNKSKKVAAINNTALPGLCQRCKEVIDWKIKYGKYKPLTVPRKCNKCQEKSVKQAYYTVCLPCGGAAGICCKCAEQKEIVQKPGLSAAEQASEDSRLEQEIKYLTERQRRSFFRLQEKGELSGKSLESKTVPEDEELEDSEEEEVDNAEKLSDSDDEAECSSAQSQTFVKSEKNNSGHSQNQVCQKLGSSLSLET